jgi:RNA polymerase sigma-70 factor (ECF subfamily)
MVLRRAKAILAHDADAEEATQEVFIRALQQHEKFENRSQVSTWLYRITTNYCLNLLRDQKRRRELLETQVPTPDLPRGNPAETGILLRTLLARADAEQAKAAICVYVDRMSHQEAAEVLGVSRRTVGNLLERFDTWAAAQTAAERKESDTEGQEGA